jgi:RimJ/RimL family protein N-acetyltransferase
MAEKLESEPSFLSGNIVELHKLQTNDVSYEYLNWIHDSDINLFLESGFFPQTLSDLRKYVTDCDESSKIILFKIVHKDTNQHVGNIKLGDINWIHRRSPVGILIGNAEFRGKGLGTETLELICDYSFRTLNLHKLTAGVDAGNASSIKLFKKLGFVEAGVLTDHSYRVGNYNDSLIFELIRSEFIS